MTGPDRFFEQACDETAALLPKVRTMGAVIEAIAALMVEAWDADGKILMAGNGGSAADAIHFNEELVVRYKRDRRPLASVSLLDGASLTCVGNDYGFDRVFSRQVQALGQPGDVFVGFTTSGNSENIRLAMEAAKLAGMNTVGFLGKDGGHCLPLCDAALVVPSTATARIQEVHQIAYHALCEYFDEWAA